MLSFLGCHPQLRQEAQAQGQGKRIVAQLQLDAQFIQLVGKTVEENKMKPSKLFEKWPKRKRVAEMHI